MVFSEIPGSFGPMSITESILPIHLLQKAKEITDFLFPLFYLVSLMCSQILKDSDVHEILICLLEARKNKEQYASI